MMISPDRVPTAQGGEDRRSGKRGKERPERGAQDSAKDTAATQDNKAKDDDEEESKRVPHVA